VVRVIGVLVHVGGSWLINMLKTRLLPPSLNFLSKASNLEAFACILLGNFLKVNNIDKIFLCTVRFLKASLRGA
jgi:hypothetical protein